MNKNPYINAVLAAVYIVCVVSVINGFGHLETIKENIFIPMAMLSLLVFSVAIMGFLFIYPSATLLLDNKRKEAVAFFSKTLITFAGFVLLFVLLFIQVGR